MESAGRLLFIALVTCYLLGRLFGGGAAPVEVVVYGMTAAFAHARSVGARRAGVARYMGMGGGGGGIVAGCDSGRGRVTGTPPNDNSISISISISN